MQVWVDHMGWGGSCRDGVGLNVNLFFPIYIQPFMNDS